MNAKLSWLTLNQQPLVRNRNFRIGTGYAMVLV